MTLPLLAVSSDEVATVLQRAGFTLAKRTREIFVLTQGCRDVVIPVGPINDETLRVLLRSASLSYSDFLDLLESAEIAFADTQVRARTLSDPE